MVLVLLAATSVRAAMGEKLNDEVARLSDDAFALLGSVNADVSGGTTPPMLAPAATLAADAQKLASAVSSGDHGRAARAMAALREDIGAFDAANKGGSAGYDANRLTSIKARYAALAADIAPDASAAVSERDDRSVAPPASAPAVASANAPRVVVSSRGLNGSRLRITGWVQGADLKSAGVYEGDREISSFDVAHSTAQQRINFDATLEEAGHGRVIRVLDNLGRSAEAPVAGSSLATTERTTHGNDKMIELDGATVSTVLPRAATRGGDINTAEIPRADLGDEPAPPRGTVGATLGAPRNVQVTILGVTQSFMSPGSVEVIGQINGEGIRRAGIYVDGRLVRQIPLASDRLSAFDVTFPMVGRTATVRAYGGGESFIETSIRIPEDYDMALRRTPPVVVAPGYNPYGNP
ncbi:MAG: hypothetical protein ACREQB_11055, partial [Candidatus Binataceae bacterium]